jgi:hypothetical protein
MTCKGTLRQVFICPTPRTHEGELNHAERRIEGQQFTKLGRKYQHDSLYLQSITSDKKNPAAKSLYR